MSVYRIRFWIAAPAVFLFFTFMIKAYAGGVYEDTDRGIYSPEVGKDAAFFIARSSPAVNRYHKGSIKKIIKLPVVKVIAHPGNIINGDSSTLKWRSQNADTVSIDQGIGDVGLRGSISISPAETTHYTFTATGPGGIAEVSVKVNVLAPPPDVDIGFGMDEHQRGGGLVGETIRIFNGNVIEARTDLLLASSSRRGFLFQVFYNSRSDITGAMGYGWSHTYEIKLDHIYHHKGLRCLRIVDGTGQAKYFRKGVSGRYDGIYGEKSRVIRIRRGGGSYEWRRLDGSRYLFMQNGKLFKIIDQRGNVLQLAYNKRGCLERVTDSASSRVMTFHYNADSFIEYVEGPVTDAVPDGIWAGYTYDSSHNLQYVTYSDVNNGSTASGFEYRYNDTNDIHNLTEKYNLAGNLLNTWGYDAEDRAVENYSSDGRGVSIIYSSEYQVDVTDAYEKKREYYLIKINGRWRISTVSDGLGGAGNAPYSSSNTVNWIYDDAMNPIELGSPGGTINQLQDYDDRGNAGTVVMASETDDESIITYTYHPHMNMPLARVESSVLSTGNTKETIWDYDNDGNEIPNEAPTTQIFRIIERGHTHDSSESVVPYEYVTVFTYNSRGQIATIDGPLPGSDDTTTYSYDTVSGDLLSVTRPIVGIITFSDYDAAGQAGLVTGLNGQSKSIDYDGRGRVLTTINMADSSVRSTGYNSAGLVLTTTDEDSVNRSFEYYSDTGLLHKQFDHELNYVSYIYDKGRMVGKSYYDNLDILSKHSSLSYEDASHDHPGLLYKEINDDGTYTQYDYDCEGNVTSVTDPNGNVTAYGYDHLNRLQTVIQPGNIITSYTYDIHSNLKTVTDAESHITSYLYDDMGRVVSTTSPDTGTVTYVYDEAGNLTQKSDAMGISVNYGYDILNRLTDISFPDSAQDISFIYDEGVNGIGRRTGMSDSSGSVVFGYDDRGRLTDRISTISGINYSLSRAYTLGSRVSSVTYPTGRSINYESINCACSVDKVTTDYNGDIVTLIDQVKYRPFGIAKALNTGAGGTVANQYDNNGRLEIANPGQEYETSYDYDNNGNLLSIISANAPWWDREYEYDELNRLTSAAGEIFGKIEYTYDDVGNRLIKTENGDTDVYTYAYGTNRIQNIAGAETIPYAYDYSGNVTGVGTDTILNYNQNNRLASVEIDGAVAGEYTYNGLGQRIIKAASGITTIFHYDFDGNIIGESDDVGYFNKEYLYRGQLRLAMVDVTTGGIYSFHNDQLGTPVLLTDNTNTVVWEAEYKPFGEAVVNVNSSVVNNFRFPGQYYDNETGLHYNYHRYYDPGKGRYLRPDPIGILGGMNLFTYSRNNPINEYDLLGLTSVIIAINRNVETSKSTIGDLTINSDTRGYALELPWNENKKNISRIPEGIYFGRYKEAKDSKFSYDVLEILNVQGRDDILFHRGNEPGDTEGCSLPGTTKSTNFVGNSKEMLSIIMGIVKITIAMDRVLGEQTEIIISIKDPSPK